MAPDGAHRGRQHGLVSCYYDDGGVGTPTWPSVATMLTDIAGILESGGSDSYRFEVRNGELSWT